MPATRMLRRAVDILNNAVKVTLAPRAATSFSTSRSGAPASQGRRHRRQGNRKLDDKFENMARRWCARFASKSLTRPATAPPPATVLAAAIVREGAKSVAAGMTHGPQARYRPRGRSRCRGSRQELQEVTRTRRSPQSAPFRQRDAEIGKFLADAMKKVGNEGVITVEEAKSAGDELEVVEGMQFDRRLHLAYFVTNADKMRVEMEDAYVPDQREKLSSLNELLPLARAVVASGSRL